ncbi:hypothetical protein [Aquimarina rubra]|uniref:DUF4397 domain-containing protein n=1 Tax=Aquimarina rubra TaxID=1920033 RepID=A0ABW5LNQ3_9FLAO
MKKLFKIFLVVMTATVFFSCEDDEKNQITDTVNAPWAYFTEISSPVINVLDLEGSAYEGRIVDGFGTIASYEMRVNRNGGAFVPFRTITEFPFDLRVTATDLADALGLTLADLGPGDKFDFLVTITDTNGLVFDGEDELQFLGDISNPGLAQALRYTTFISCPFVSSEIGGIYEIQPGGTAGLFAAGSQFEVIAGPGDNQYSIVDFGDPAFNSNLVINVDPATGISIPSGDQLYDFGFSLNPAESNAGFTFSCSGNIVLTAFSYTCCGNFPLVMSKI